MKVLITGGSGLIGSRITSMLLDKGVEVVHLTRMPNSKFGIKTYYWNWRTKEIDDNCLNDVTDIIHLAGTPIADKPWTMKRKHEIVQSRVFSARFLLQKIKSKEIQLNSYTSASGIGYYGARTLSKTFTEEDSPYDDFIAKCCVYWENSAKEFNEIADRVTILRTGIVIDKEKGAFPKMSKFIRKGLGSPIGNGLQACPWIYIDDIARLYVEVLFNKKYSGVYNAVAPEKINNKEFTKITANFYNKKIILPNVPSFVLKGIYGEMASLILEGSPIACDKLMDKGFTFKASHLKEAFSLF